MVYFYFASKFKYAFSPAFFKFVSSNGIVARAVHIMRAKKKRLCTSVIRRHGCLTSDVVDGGSSWKIEKSWNTSLKTKNRNSEVSLVLSNVTVKIR